MLECEVTKSRPAEALDISRQSIDNWVDTFKRSGREGLINSYKGSRRKGRQEHARELPIGNRARQLEAISRCRAWIKRTPEAVLIRLEPLEVPRFQAAQIQLCQVLN